MIKKMLQNTRNPQGRLGRFMINAMNSGHRSLADWAFEYIRISPDMHILDIGCGGGANVARMLRQCGNGYVNGVDYSEESVAVSRKNNAGALGKNCEIIKGNVAALPYQAGQFDLVTAFETVYFWPEITESFRKVRNIIRDGGRFAIVCEMSDPTNTMWTNKIDGMTIYDAADLQKRLKEAGFSSVEFHHTKKEWICVIAQK